MEISKKITAEKGTERLKRGFARMCKGGVIMDVVNAEQAIIAERAGAVAVMALHKVPSDIRKAGGIARMADTQKIKEIMDAVTIPVMAKSRIGHISEAKVLEALSVAMIRTKGEPGTGDVAEAVRHTKMIDREIKELQKMEQNQLEEKSKEYRVPLSLVLETKNLGRLPVVNFAAGGIATPADAALMMELGSDGIFVGSGIFKSDNPEAFAKAIVEATLNFKDAKKVLAVSGNLGEPMKGIDRLEEREKMQIRSE